MHLYTTYLSEMRITVSCYVTSLEENLKTTEQCEKYIKIALILSVAEYVIFF